MQTVKELAKELQIPPHRIYYDISKGFLTAEKRPLESNRGKGYEYIIAEEEKQRYKEVIKETPIRISNHYRPGTIPPCHRCGRIFERPGEYVVQPFEEGGVLSWHPVCRTSGCSQSSKNVSEMARLKEEIADLKLKNKQLALELGKLRQSITNILTRGGYE